MLPLKYRTSKHKGKEKLLFDDVIKADAEFKCEAVSNRWEADAEFKCEAASNRWESLGTIF